MAETAKRWLHVGLLTAAIGFLSLGSVGSKEPAGAPGSTPNEARPNHLPGKCSSPSSMLAPGEDPCPLLEQANEVLTRLHPSAANYVKSVACEFNLEGNLEIQQALLREDLIWQQKGFGARQLDALVFVSVAFAFQDAEGLLQELDQRLKKETDASLSSRRQRVSLFRTQAFALLQELSPRIKDLPAGELEFRF